jgi:hypothetical protein
MNTFIISKRYMAIIEIGAEDHLIKIDESDIAMMPMNKRYDKVSVDLLILGKEILLINE